MITSLRSSHGFGLFNPYDSTEEVAIQEMIEGAQRMIITVNSEGETGGEVIEEEELGINLAIRKTL
jgi:hypothetical protein